MSHTKIFHNQDGSNLPGGDYASRVKAGRVQEKGGREGGGGL